MVEVFLERESVQKELAVMGGGAVVEKEQRVLVMVVV